MNTSKKVAATAAGNASDVTCINCGADYNINASPECPCCGLHYQEMTCQHCGENFRIPQDINYYRYFTCPNCHRETFRPFYFGGITEYPLMQGSFVSQYPETSFPEISLESTDYPFELDSYPAIFNLAPAANPPLERVVTSSQKEYAINVKPFPHEGSSPFLRLRGMSLLCNTLNFPKGGQLRLRLRDRKSYHIIEKAVTPEINVRALCVFDFGVDERYFTKDITVSFQMVKDGKVITGDIPLVRSRDFRDLTWTDKSGNGFTPALALYGYTVDPDTGYQGFFYSTTAFPETEYPTTEYPTTEYPVTEYSRDNYPTAGYPEIIYPELENLPDPSPEGPAPTFFDSSRSAIDHYLYYHDNKEYLPEDKWIRGFKVNLGVLNLKGLFYVQPQSGICAYIEQLEFALKQSSLDVLKKYDLQATVFMDKARTVNATLDYWKVKIDLAGNNLTEEERKLSYSSQIRVQFQGRHKVTGEKRIFDNIAFCCDKENRIFACVSGNISNPQSSSSEYPTTEYPDSSSSSYADWDYPTGGAPAVIGMTYMLEADFWHQEVGRGQVERRSLPSLALPLGHVVFPEDMALEIYLIDVCMAPETTMNRTLELWVDGEKWKGAQYEWDNRIVMRMKIEKFRQNWEDRLAKVPTIEIKAADGKNLDFFFDRISGNPVAAITGKIRGLPTPAYPTTEYPTTDYPTTAYLSTEYDNLSAVGNIYAARGSLGEMYPASYGLDSLSDSSSSYPGAGEVLPRQGQSDAPDTQDEVNACPTAAFPTPGTDGAEEGEAGVNPPFGGGPSDNGGGDLPQGNLSMGSPRLEIEMASPSVLTYRHITQRRVGGFNSPTGLIQDATQVCVFTERGFPRFTDFSKNPQGERSDRSLTLAEQLRKITIDTDDGSGLPPQTSYFEEILGDGTLLRYSQETGDVVAMKSPNSPWITAEKLKADIHVVYEKGQSSSSAQVMRTIPHNIYLATAKRAECIRQIWSRRDGLLDIIVLSDTSYDIRWYAPESVGDYSESTGRYGLLSGASPVKVWTVEATLLSYTIKADGKKYETGTDRILSEEDLKYLKSLRITEKRGEMRFVSLWEQPDSSTLVFTRGEGADAETKVTKRIATDPATYAELLAENPTMDATFLKVGDILTREVEEIQTVPGIPGGTRIRSRRYPFGDVVVLREEGVGSAHPITVTYQYDMDTTSPAYGCCLKETHSNGKVVTQNYDAKKRLLSRTEPWAGGTSKITRYTYDNRPENLQRQTSATEYLIVNGKEKEISRTSYAYRSTPEMLEEKVTRIGISSPGGGSNIPRPEISLTQWYGLDPETNGAGCIHAVNRLKRRCDATGVQYDYLYQNGTEDGISYICFVTQTSRGNIVPGLSTCVAHYYDGADREVHKCEYVHTGEEFTLVNEESYIRDASHRIIRTNKAKGKYTTASWICKGPLQETDDNGVQTRYEYNSAKRLFRVTKSATPYIPQPGAPVTNFSLPAQITEYRFDAAGRQIRQSLKTGDKVTTTSTEWDALGRVALQTDELGRTTRYTYSPDGLQTTGTNPTGATYITRNHLDGNILSETGTGQQACFYTYSCNNWELVTQVRLDSATGPVVKEIYTGGLGQTIYTREARGEGHLLATLSRYDISGRLIARQEENRQEVRTEYDALGNAIRETRQQIAPRRNLVTETKKSYILKSMEGAYLSTPAPEWKGRELVWLRTTQSAYAGDRDRAVKSTRWELVSQHLPHVQEALVILDKYGNESATWKETQQGNEYSYTAVNGAKGRNCTMTLDGKTVWEQSLGGEKKTYAYFSTSSGDRLAVTDGRGNATIRETDMGGRVIASTDAAGNRTTFAYDPVTGQMMRQTNPLGKSIEYTYDIRGRLISQYGAATQPMCFEYDAADRMTALYTWRVPEGTIIAPPTDRSDADITRWIYHSASGSLLKKQMADGSTLTYHYNGKGQVRSRTQAGANTTYYGYDLQTDQMLTIRYSDGTPGVTFTRDDWGNILSVKDAGGKRQYRYDHRNDLDKEIVEGPSEGTLSSFRDNKGRDNGYLLSLQGQNCQEMTMEYGDDFRLRRVRLGSNRAYEYTWNAESGLPATITSPNGIVKEWIYESHRNQVSQIRYAVPGATPLVAQENTYDALGRLTTRRNPDKGTTRHDYAYNDRSEVTRDILDRSERWTYSYDNLGNRITAGGMPGESTYKTNKLNQYTDIISIGAGGTPGTKVFRPVYDACGNQTLVETDTGIWNIQWNAENRPIVFSKGDERIECLYDYMGRRTRKLHLKGDYPVSHLCYMYNGYKLVAELDALSSSVRPEVVKTWLWDPTRNQDASPLEINIWKEESEMTSEYPTTDYPETEYPTTEYPTAPYPSEKFFTSADLLLIDRKENAFVITTYEDEGFDIYFEKRIMPEDKVACIDRIELALDGARAEMASCRYRATVHLRKKLTVYAELEGDVLHLDLTGLAGSLDRTVSDSRSVHIDLEKCEKNDPGEHWSVCKWIPYYINNWNEPYIKHVTGVLLRRENSSSTEYPTTEYPTTEYPTTEYPTTEYPTTEYPTTEYPTTEYAAAPLNVNVMNRVSMDGKQITSPQSRNRPVVTSDSGGSGCKFKHVEPPYPTFYPTTEYECPQYTFFNDMPGMVWGRGSSEGVSCRNSDEVLLNLHGEISVGNDVLVDAVEIALDGYASGLPETNLAAKIHLDRKPPITVQVTKSSTNTYRMDLSLAGLSENARTLTGDREIMIKMKQGDTEYKNLRVYCNGHGQPQGIIQGRLLPKLKARETYYCLTDHNKNITALTDKNATLRAAWDYDAFGNCISQSGDKDNWNPLRYSSEYYDQELGLIYYNYRHYNPKEGRWISRDLIEERGGYNMYDFLMNNSMILFDFLGLEFEKLSSYQFEYIESRTEFLGVSNGREGGRGFPDDSKLKVYNRAPIWHGTPIMNVGKLEMKGKPEYKIQVLKMSDNETLKSKNHEIKHFNDYKSQINDYIDFANQYEGICCHCQELMEYIQAYRNMKITIFNKMNNDLDISDYSGSDRNNAISKSNALSIAVDKSVEQFVVAMRIYYKSIGIQ